MIHQVAQKLFGAKEAVARVAKTRNDVAVLIELFVNMRNVDVHIRVRGLHGGDALRRGNQAPPILPTLFCLRMWIASMPKLPVASIGSTMIVSRSAMSCGSLQ